MSDSKGAPNPEKKATEESKPEVKNKLDIVKEVKQNQNAQTVLEEINSYNDGVNSLDIQISTVWAIMLDYYNQFIDREYTGSRIDRTNPNDEVITDNLFMTSYQYKIVNKPLETVESKKYFLKEAKLDKVKRFINSMSNSLIKTSYKSNNYENYEKAQLKKQNRLSGGMPPALDGDHIKDRIKYNKDAGAATAGSVGAAGTATAIATKGFTASAFASGMLVPWLLALLATGATWLTVYKYFKNKKEYKSIANSFKKLGLIFAGPSLLPALTGFALVPLLGPLSGISTAVLYGASALSGLMISRSAVNYMIVHNKDELEKIDISYVYKDATPTEVQFGLATKRYFKFSDPFFVKSSSGKDNLLLENYFDEWFTGTTSVDKKGEKDKLKQNTVIQYLQQVKSMINRDIIVDIESDISEIMNENFYTVVDSLKDSKTKKFKPSIQQFIDSHRDLIQDPQGDGDNVNLKLTDTIRLDIARLWGSSNINVGDRVIYLRQNYIVNKVNRGNGKIYIRLTDSKQMRPNKQQRGVIPPPPPLLPPLTVSINDVVKKSDLNINYSSIIKRYTNKLNQAKNILDIQRQQLRQRQQQNRFGPPPEPEPQYTQDVVNAQQELDEVKSRIDEARKLRDKIITQLKSLYAKKLDDINKKGATSKSNANTVQGIMSEIPVKQEQFIAFVTDKLRFRFNPEKRLESGRREDRILFFNALDKSINPVKYLHDKKTEGHINIMDCIKYIQQNLDYIVSELRNIKTFIIRRTNNAIDVDIFIDSLKLDILKLRTIYVVKASKLIEQLEKSNNYISDNTTSEDALLLKKIKQIFKKKNEVYFKDVLSWSYPIKTTEFSCYQDISVLIGVLMGRTKIHTIINSIHSRLNSIQDDLNNGQDGRSGSLYTNELRDNFIPDISYLSNKKEKKTYQEFEKKLVTLDPMIPTTNQYRAIVNNFVTIKNARDSIRKLNYRQLSELHSFFRRPTDTHQRLLMPSDLQAQILGRLTGEGPNATEAREQMATNVLSNSNKYIRYIQRKYFGEILDTSLLEGTDKDGEFSNTEFYNVKNKLGPGHINPINVIHTEIFRDYLGFIFSYNVIKLLISDKTKLLNKVNDILIDTTPTGIGKSADFRYRKWLEERGLEEYIPVLESRTVRGNLDVLVSLRTLNERPEARKKVVQGRSPASIERLNSAIKELNDDFTRENKEKEEQKKRREEKKKRRKEEQEKQKQEKQKKEEAEKKRILELRKKMEEKSKQKESELNKIKQQEAQLDKQLDKDVVDKAKDKSDDKEQKDKLDDKEQKDKPKSKSLYERLFGTTQETVLKKGSYIPSDKKMIQVAEEELTEYKAVRDKLTEQIKTDKLRKADELGALKQNVTDKLKELEYIERSEKDKLSAEYSNLLRLKDELEKAGEKRLEMLKEREETIRKKRQQDLDELNKLYEEYIDKIQFHRGRDKNRYLLELINSYDGTSGSMMELKARLQRLVEIDISQKRIRRKLTSQKRRAKREKRTRKKLRNPDRGVYSVKELLVAR